MAPEERQPGTSVRENLFAEYYGFSFYKAVHLLESLFPEMKRLGETLSPRNEAVRFSARPGFAFPPSDISRLERADPKKPVDMQVTFMGLIGPNGVMPHWFHELVLERLRQKDSSLAAFLDIFHHRLISLLYLAWKKYRFPENYLPGGRDKLSGHLLSLIGLGTPGLPDSVGLPREALIFYSGLLSRTVPSAVCIASAVRYHAETDVEIDQFVERLIPIDTEDRTQLGAANGRLGVDAVCGSFAWECRTKFRVNLGPLGYSRFVRFLPSGDMLQPIFSLVRYMVGIEYEIEVGLYLKREEVPLCELGGASPTSPRLGWSTWLKNPGFTHARNPYAAFPEPKR